MKKIMFLLLMAIVWWSCHSRKTSMHDEENVEVTDFIEFFPEVSLPFQVSDTSLLKKTSDSLLIGYKIFTQFIPDSILTRDFGKGIFPHLYPLGRAKEKGKETYLFVKATNGTKRVGYLITFSKDNEFLNALRLVRTGYDAATSAYGLVDSKFQITTYREERRPGREIKFKRNVYIFNSAANIFTLIMTEPNEDIIENIFNPIDTLPRRNKFSGDYARDKRNFISIRDGKNNSQVQFFVHFEKNNGGCSGELKGIARFISKNVAQYEERGNPCALEFIFSASSITMKETGGCGAYRDIKCFFEGTYLKKKEAKTKSPVPKK